MAEIGNAPTPSFAFEQVAAKLVPFDLLNQALMTGTREVDQRLEKAQITDQSDPGSLSAGMSATKNRQRKLSDQHALYPIIKTGGLVFPYNPSISEGVSVKYDAIDLVHANESVYVYKATDNVRITITDATWTCDTFDNAVYALSAIHFFRSYSQMDFGRNRTGRPPSPMWFSAFGNYAFHRVPVLLEKADWSFPNDVDYVGIPEFGSTEYIERRLNYRRDASGSYTWLPMTVKVASISLVVQHSPTYWRQFNLDDYRSGAMLRRRNSFHAISPTETSNRRRNS